MRACFCPRRAATLRGVGFTLAGCRGSIPWTIRPCLSRRALLPFTQGGGAFPWGAAWDPYLCRDLCRNPAIPTHVERSRLMSLALMCGMWDSAQTLMNTAPPHLFVSLSVARLFRQQRTVTAEAAGSSPVVPAIIRNPLMNGLPSMNGCSRI